MAVIVDGRRARTARVAALLVRRTAALVLMLGSRAHAEETTIEVRGELSPRGARDDVAASAAIVGEKLREPGATSADVLATVPGVQVSRSGSSSDLSTASIRGATSAQTPVYLAGVRLNDDLTGTADLSTIPLSLVRRVEVYRGSTPVELDRAGIGGAVLFEPRFEPQTKLAAGVGAGSFGERSGFVTASVAGGGAASSLTLARERADNDWTFSDAEGNQRRRTNADYGASSLWSISRLQLAKRVRVLGILHGYYREQGTPGLAVLPDEQARTSSDRLLAAVDVRIRCGAAPETEDCAVQLVTSALRAGSSLQDPVREIIPAARAWSRGDRLEQSVRLTKRLGQRVTLLPSFAVARERIDAGYTGQQAAQASRVLLRPSLAGELDLGAKTSLVAAIALESDSANSSAVSPGSAVLTPVLRLGARLDVAQGLQARVNAGYYSRTPTLGELYGVSANVHGNASLRAERGPTADAGLRLVRSWPWLRLQADALAFAREASELIAYRQTGPAAISPYNVGRARVLGIESALAAELFDHLSTGAAITVLDPRDKTDGRRERNDILPFRSRLVVAGELELYAREPWTGLPLERLALGARLLHRSSKYSDSAGLLVVPHQTVIDLHVGALFRQQSLAVRAALRNALDAPELDAVGVPLSGRSVHLSVEGQLL